MREFMNRFQNWIQKVARFVFGLRLAVGISIVLLILASIPQVVELGEAEAAEMPMRFALSWGAALLYLFAFREVYTGPRAQHYFGPRAGASPALKIVIWLILGLLGGAPLLLNAFLWTKDVEPTPRLVLCACIPVVSALILMLTGRETASAGRLLSTHERRETATLVFGVIVFAAMTWSVIYYQAGFPRFVGPIALICVFLSLALLILSPIEFWLNKASIPTYSVLFLAIFSTGYLSYGGDNFMRRIRGGSGWDRDQEDNIGIVFEKWLECRDDLASHLEKGQPYPVFLVATEGGGTKAAIHTNTVLSKLQLANPTFSEHVFLISGVSGGSIGAAAFSAAMSLKSQKRRPATCRSKSVRERPGVEPAVTDDQALEIASSVVSADYLAPIVGAALFPSNLARFIPGPAPSLDSARWFEYGLEASWSDAMKLSLNATSDQNVFDEDFYTFWQPAASHPALALNVVDADHGFLKIFAPFTLGKPPRGSFGVGQIQVLPVRTILKNSVEKSSVRLSTAVGVSARFPYAFGPAVIEKVAKVVSEHYVDGGYFDNTGINTAAIIHAHLEDAATKFKERYRSAEDVYSVYVITIGGYETGASNNASSPFPSLTFPIVALNNTRAARTSNTHVILRDSGIRHIEFKAQPDDKQYALGLFGSKRMGEEISYRVGEAENCDAASAYRDKSKRPLKDGVADAPWPDIEKKVIAFNSCNLLAVKELLQ
jgi:Patatin-like phospholipase